MLKIATLRRKVTALVKPRDLLGSDCILLCVDIKEWFIRNWRQQAN